MRYFNRLCVGLLIVGVTGAHGQAVKKKSPYLDKPVTFDEAELRQAVFDTAARFVGLTERTNQNDAPWITKINRANHLPDRAHYCASAYYYVHAVNGARLPVKGIGWVRSYFGDPNKIIYRKNQRGNQRLGIKPQQMDAVSLFASHIEGIADTHWDSESDYVRCIGFNTTANGSRGGCYINRRRKSEIKAIANWLTPYLKTVKKL